MADIGFIGLGNMGGPMAKNLVKAGKEVQGFDLVPAAREAAATNGVSLVESAGRAARDVPVVISMLPAGEQVREVYLGEDGVFANARRGAVLIDCSTIDVVTAREVAAEAGERGFDMLDAPVSGGVAGADAGTLTFMVGGSDAGFEAAKPLFEIMGRNVVHAGGAGNGQAAKVCNNMILGISMIACAEAFTMAKKLGLEPKTFFDISSKASGSCWAMLNHNPVPGLVETSAANRDYKPGFATAMMAKDLKLAQAAAAHAGVATPLGAEAAALYAIHMTHGKGGLDYSSIIKLIGGEEP